MKIQNIKKIINDKNKTKLIGLLTILIGLWLILYFLPELFVTLFNTLLGNLILFIIVLLVFLKNKVYGIGIGIILIVLIRFSRLSKESFTSNSELTFLNIQHTINRQNVFDMDIIGKQASQEELDYFNKHGMWPWSNEVINLFNELQNKNPYVRTTPGDATTHARTIYNEAAILQLLSHQTKEGQFLLNGILVKNPQSVEKLPNGYGNFVYDSGLVEDKTNDIIKCNLVANDQNPKLERIIYTGKGGIFGQQMKKIEPVDYNDLENIIPGFKFLSSPCNPCSSLNSIPDYSCKYSLNIKDEKSGPSNLWKYLWKN